MKKQKKITLKFKRHLEKVLKRPSTQQPYQTTMHGIHDWFDHYNAALFENKLPNFDDIKIKRIHGALGQVVYTTYKTRDQKFVLEMLPRYETKKMFLETLVHEMIHLYQMKIKHDTGNHNKLFFGFRKKLNFLGLRLSR